MAARLITERYLFSWLPELKVSPASLMRHVVTFPAEVRELPLSVHAKLNARLVWKLNLWFSVLSLLEYSTEVR